MGFLEKLGARLVSIVYGFSLKPDLSITIGWGYPLGKNGPQI
jgi:hypothetical protein